MNRKLFYILTIIYVAIATMTAILMTPNGDFLTRVIGIITIDTCIVLLSVAATKVLHNK